MATATANPASNERQPIVAIEGGVCSGKSTLLRYSELIAGVSIAREYFDIMQPSEIDRLLSLQREDRASKLLEIDRIRLSQLRGTSHVIVIDRSVLTIIATDFAFGASAEPDWWSAVFTDAALAELLPSRVLYLDVNHQEQLQRWRERGGKPYGQPFLDCDFNTRFREAFQRLATVVSVTFVESLGDTPQKALFAMIDDVLSHGRDAPRTDSLTLRKALFRG